MNDLVGKWEKQLLDLKCDLVSLGGKPETFEYNLLATEALCLSQCIIDIKTYQVNKLSESIENAIDKL